MKNNNVSDDNTALEPTNGTFRADHWTIMYTALMLTLFTACAHLANRRNPLPANPFVKKIHPGEFGVQVNAGTTQTNILTSGTYYTFPFVKKIANVSQSSFGISLYSPNIPLSGNSGFKGKFTIDYQIRQDPQALAPHLKNMGDEYAITLVKRYVNEAFEQAMAGKEKEEVLSKPALMTRSLVHHLERRLRQDNVPIDVNSFRYEIYNLRNGDLIKPYNDFYVFYESGQPLKCWPPFRFINGVEHSYQIYGDTVKITPALFQTRGLTR